MLNSIHIPFMQYSPYESARIPEIYYCPMILLRHSTVYCKLAFSTSEKTEPTDFFNAIAYT